jgi:hypothetical protein
LITPAVTAGTPAHTAGQQRQQKQQQSLLMCDTRWQHRWFSIAETVTVALAMMEDKARFANSLSHGVDKAVGPQAL